MEQQALWIVAVIGTGTLVGVFWKMKGGFGPLNLRVVGLVLIAVLASLLAVAKSDTLNAAMGLLGAIAGYLFGAKADGETSNDQSSSVSAEAATFGDNARVAGRDINETVNNLRAQVQDLGQLIAAEGSKIDKVLASEDQSNGPMDYLLNTIYERQLSSAGPSIQIVVRRWEAEGWKLKGLSSDFHGMDGLWLVFERPMEGSEPTIRVFHGNNMTAV